MSNDHEFKLRPALEIQKAHDLLVGIILGEVFPTAPEEVKDHAKTCASVLCWVLHHDHNESFGTLITNLEANLQKAGYTIERLNN